MDSSDLFGRIFEEHRHAVHAFLLGRTGDREAAADLLQETFLRAWRRLPELRELPAERQRAWIFTVARNLVIDTYRARATRSATEDALRREAAHEPVAGYDDPEARAVLSERVAALDKAIRDLPEQLRTVLTMHTVGGLNSGQISGIVGVPPGTVRYRLSLARRQLAAALGLEAGD